MLINESQAALNDVIVACREAAAHYAEAAGWVEGTPLATLLRELDQQHEDFAAQLAAEVRRLGGLPRDLNADRELVERWITGMRATFSGDRRQVLLEEREVAEAEIVQLISDALVQELSGETAALLKNMQVEVRAIKDGLAQEKSES